MGRGYWGEGFSGTTIKDMDKTVGKGDGFGWGRVGGGEMQTTVIEQQ